MAQKEVPWKILPSSEASRLSQSESRGVGSSDDEYALIQVEPTNESVPGYVGGTQEAEEPELFDKLRALRRQIGQAKFALPDYPVEDATGERAEATLFVDMNAYDEERKRNLIARVADLCEGQGAFMTFFNKTNLAVERFMANPHFRRFLELNYGLPSKDGGAELQQKVVFSNFFTEIRSLAPILEIVASLRADSDKNRQDLAKKAAALRRELIKLAPHPEMAAAATAVQLDSDQYGQKMFWALMLFNMEQARLKRPAGFNLSEVSLLATAIKNMIDEFNTGVAPGDR